MKDETPAREYVRLSILALTILLTETTKELPTMELKQQIYNNLKYNPNIKTTCKKCGSDNIHERIGGWRGLKDNSISINEEDGFSLYELFTCGDCMEECDIEQKTKVEETTK